LRGCPCCKLSFRSPCPSVTRILKGICTGRVSCAWLRPEIAPLRDPRVHSNAAYLLIILLSRVITRLGALEQVNPKMVEGLYAADLAYLQDLYRRINENGHDRVRTRCPHCEQEFDLELAHLGGSGATP
jgi:hypothetical protein